MRGAGQESLCAKRFYYNGNDATFQVSGMPISIETPTEASHAATKGYVNARAHGRAGVVTNVVASFLTNQSSGFVLSNRLEIAGWANGVCTSTAPRSVDVKVGEYMAP